MAANVIAHPITIEEFLELERNAPDDVHDELVDGPFREDADKATRSWEHSEAMIRTGQVPVNWLDGSGRVRRVTGGGVRCLLFTDPDVTGGPELPGVDLRGVEVVRMK